ncbi:C1 protein [Tobacco leaf curl Japan betasatellite]|uniref:C1 protein n=1 Tax=Tobacco leaf curl Japan betasatellite TaxID=2010326 RepID=A4F1V8_9VIRU|nr:C1 protein [Tobacco leaf curl Japan betasatellite]BAF49375.1 C1 protein [Tobacco leaf curl Japan betasatellite]
MTITYSNGNGIKFIIDVRLQQFISVSVQVYSTNQAILTGFNCNIPYTYEQIIAPFDFNGTEEIIRNTLELMYEDSDVSNFQVEDMIETIDILMTEMFTDMGVETMRRCIVRHKYTV